ncbi:hypothetical protein GCM10010442_33040 [Kitasatospora kifunensis]
MRFVDLKVKDVVQRIETDWSDPVHMQPHVQQLRLTNAVIGVEPRARHLLHTPTDQITRAHHQAIVSARAGRINGSRGRHADRGITAATLNQRN